MMRMSQNVSGYWPLWVKRHVTPGWRVVMILLCVAVTVVEPAVARAAATTTWFSQLIVNDALDGTDGVSKTALPLGAIGSSVPCLIASGNTMSGEPYGCADTGTPGMANLWHTAARSVAFGGGATSVAAEVLSADPMPMLTVSLVGASSELQPGDPVTYTVVPGVAAGSDEAAAVTMTQTLPSGVVPLGAFGAGWVCPAPQGQRVSCTNSNSPFVNGTLLPAIKVVAIVTGVDVTPAVIHGGSSAAVSSIDAVPGIASSAVPGIASSDAQGLVSSTPTDVMVSPASGLAIGGNAVTISGANIIGANAIEIGTTAEFQAGAPAVLLPCSTGPAVGCFTVSDSTLRIASMPAHSAAPVWIKVVNDGVAGAATFTYAEPLPDPSVSEE